jgi:hypothetical protein
VEARSQSPAENYLLELIAKLSFVKLLFLRAGASSD